MHNTRRIAGHANASRGEPILWVIGVDERNPAACGVDNNELADWIAQVKSRFSDSFCPELLTSLTVRTDNVTLVALYFATDRAPYLVTNPDGGAIQHEVPWRAGTAIRTARRGDLLRLLTPVVRLPRIEVLFMEVDVSYPKPEPDTAIVTMRTTVFLSVTDGRRFTVPSHLCSAWVRSPADAIEVLHVRPTEDDLTKKDPDGFQVQIDGAGRARIECRGKLDGKVEGKTLGVGLELGIVECDGRAVRTQVQIPRSGPAHKNRWTTG